MPRTAFVVVDGWENEEGFHFTLQVEDSDRDLKHHQGPFLGPDKASAKGMVASKLSEWGYDVGGCQIVWR